MKLWRVDFHDRDHGVLVSWHVKKREALSELRQLQRERDEPQGIEAITEVNVPATRLGLCAWLNIHLTTDNG